MRLVPDLNGRIKILEQRQRDRRKHIEEQEELYARRQREIDNLKALRDAHVRGEANKEDGVGGVSFGPLEIFVSCNEPGCNAEAMVWAGDPDAVDAPAMPLPAGWTSRDSGTYCPRHS